MLVQFLLEKLSSCEIGGHKNHSQYGVWVLSLLHRAQDKGDAMSKTNQYYVDSILPLRQICPERPAKPYMACHGYLCAPLAVSLGLTGGDLTGDLVVRICDSLISIIERAEGQDEKIPLVRIVGLQIMDLASNRDVP
jgi:hypothetical protein